MVLRLLAVLQFVTLKQNIMKKLISAIFRNPKTTVAGAIGILLTVALQMQKIDEHTYTVLIGLAASMGFVVAKDGNVTGTGV